MFAQFEEQAEYERLQIQENAVDWVSRGRLSSLGIAEGARCLEAGVGAGSMLRWMAFQVGPAGHVLGVDLDDRFFAASEGPNVELRKADLLTTPLEAASFDFIHCRVLLMHLKVNDRKALLARFLSALKPGGWILVLDPALDTEIGLTHNRGQELWRRLLRSIVEATTSIADFSLGTRLPRLLMDVGFADVEGYTTYALPEPGGVNHTYMLNILDGAGRRFVVSSGLMSDAELDELRECVLAGDVDIAFPGGSAWGRRPS